MRWKLVERTPMAPNVPFRSAWAARFGEYPSWSIACTTRARVLGLTESAPVETRETVCGETPARRATSPIDGPDRRRPGAGAVVMAR